jgi:hypothetical protein
MSSGPSRKAGRVLHGLLHEGRVADVTHDRHAAAPGRLDVAQRLLGIAVLGRVPVQDHHVGAFLGEADGHRAADAAVAAGDDGPLAGELPGRLPVLHEGAGPGRHLRLDAGLMGLRLRRLELFGHGM